VRQLNDAGAIVIGKTGLHEFAYGVTSNNPHFGAVRNPWDTERIPGGSSGGSAAVVAAHLVPFATGTDTGGSIRIPASFCGVVGFKPPYGRVPETEIFNLDHYCHEGPLARNVADCALLQNVIAGPDASDVVSLRPKLVIPDRLDAIHGLRIALSTDLGCYQVDKDVVANTRAAADRLREAGATVEEVSLPWELADITRAATIHFGMIFGPSVQEIYDKHADQLNTYTRRLVEDSAKISKDDFVKGLELEGRIYAPLGELLDRYDALICPTFAVPAFPAEYEWTDALDALMTIPFNIASRCPVISVPSGRSRDGVPTGLSVVGKTYDDITAFRVAAAHEQRFPWLDEPSRRPAL
jgi:aspartyl-tRNA(Asn)/glutamyl-tRNA(Gln) amidotransferase subunit A